MAFCIEHVQCAHSFFHTFLINAAKCEYSFGEDRITGRIICNPMLLACSGLKIFIFSGTENTKKKDIFKKFNFIQFYSILTKKTNVKQCLN